jgi:hypothetical protein
MGRTLAVARLIATKPELTRRYTRLALTQRYKRLMHEGLPLSLSLTGMAVTEILQRGGT